MQRIAVAVVLMVTVVPSGVSGERPSTTRPQTAPAAEKTMVLDLGGGVSMTLVRIPPGEFQMGSPDGEKERDDNEGPGHTVRITRGFYLGTCEVTNAQYRRFRPDHTGRWMDGDNQPALWVSWYDAVAFCRWLSERTGKSARLPTEAEWEYACRAGTRTRFWSGDQARGVMDSADLARAAWYGATSGGISHDVGQKPANAFGLHDMHGNAWEWCLDWYAADYYARSPAEDPAGPEKGQARVLRGGCYAYWTSYYCRSAHRYRFRPDGREPVIGFRVAADDGPARKLPLPDVTQPWPPPRQIVSPYQPAGPVEADVAKNFGPPAVEVPRADAPPKIDGRLDDPCWFKARPLAFRYLSGRAAPPSQPTAARMLCDADNLYVCWDCTEEDMSDLVAHGSKRDDPVWQGDTVEVFLDPRHEEQVKGYFHVAVNPNGVTMDTRNDDPAWDPGLKVATSKSQRGWSVELAVPFAELGLAKGEVLTVWGVNLTRYRPEIATGRPKKGALVPHSWPVDEPDRLRLYEDTGWAPTLSDTSHVPSRFGHAAIATGTKPTAPPERLFELIAREDFSQGKGKFSAGKVVEGGYMGSAKALELTGSEVAIWQVPLTKFRDVSLLVAMRSSPSPLVYWHTFGRMYDTNKCCAVQVDTLTRDFVKLMPTFNYCDGAGRIDATSNGVADAYYAGFSKHLLWFSEPTIGHVGFAGPDHWAVVHARLGHLNTQHPHNRRVDPDADSLPGWYFHSGGGDDQARLRIGRAVLFRGIDTVPPDKPTGLACKVEGDQAVLSWKPADDNTVTVWYRVTAGGGKDAAVVAEAPDLTARVPLAKVKGQSLTVSALDYFENVSEPSDPVQVK